MEAITLQLLSLKHLNSLGIHDACHHRLASADPFAALYFVERKNFFPLYIQATKDKILHQQTILRNISKNILQTQDIIYSNNLFKSFPENVCQKAYNKQ